MPLALCKSNSIDLQEGPQLTVYGQLLITIVYTVDIFELYLVFITDCTVLNIPL